MSILIQLVLTAVALGLRGTGKIRKDERTVYRRATEKVLCPGSKNTSSVQEQEALNAVPA